MTTTTPDTVGIAVPETRRPSAALRFAVAFIVGLLLATVARRRRAVRIRPAVHRPGAARRARRRGRPVRSRRRPRPPSACARPTARLGEGEIVLTTPAGDTTISYADIGRGPDVDAMLAEALAVGREGNAVERVIADARTAIRGRDPGAAGHLRRRRPGRARSSAYADSLARDPVDASVEKIESRFVVHAGVAGRLADPPPPVEAALADLGELDAPASADLRRSRPAGRARDHHGRGVRGQGHRRARSRPRSR